MGGTVEAAPGGIPAAVPTKTIKDHRDAILAAFTQSLDACIEAAAAHPETLGKSPTTFGAEVTFSFAGTTEQIKAHPALDFTAVQTAVATPEDKPTTPGLPS